MDERDVNVDAVRQQSEFLDIAVRNGYFNLIDKGTFPNLPEENLAIARFFALESLTDSYYSVITLSEDEVVNERIRGRIADLLEDRFTLLREVLPEEQHHDRDLVGTHPQFRQSPDQTHLLQAAVTFGLVDQINPKNFQALRSLSDSELNLLKLTALDNRRLLLKGIKSQLRDQDTASLDNELSDVNSEISRIALAAL